MVLDEGLELLRIVIAHADRVYVLIDQRLVSVSSVDEHQSRRVLDALVEGHRTAVLAMHDLELALTYANRIIGLQDGRITLDESTDGMSAKDLDGLYGN